MTLLGWEIGKAVQADKSILVRPNVNSDIQWELIAPAVFDGSITKNRVKYYGYTKIPDYVLGKNKDGNVTNYYRVCYSHNESSPSWKKLTQFIERGGSVAVVTNRKPHNPIRQWAKPIRVIDADLTDEWIFKSGVIGDLSAKGRAAKLAGVSKFIYDAYAYQSSHNLRVAK
jgi:hypothetical protein